MAYIAAVATLHIPLGLIMHKQAGRHSKRVIIVDHDAETIELIAELLRDEGFAPLSYPTWLLSVTNIEQAQANLLILDLGLGDPCAALELLRELRRNEPTRALPVLVNSTDDRQLAQLAEALRELDCVVLAKPFDLDDFFSSINVCLDAGRSHMPRLAC
jgi:chemosensory pili system protein ChpA (sensor histidine kinase/response regulator)